MNFFKKTPYVIAEVGVNHNGKLSLALASIKAASKAGADAVKFQIFKADEFMSKEKLIYKYKTKSGYRYENMYDMFRRLEFSEKWLNTILKECKKYKIDFLSSVADTNSADLMKKIKVKAIKLSSEDLINYPLLEYVSNLGLNVILSSGMADEKEIKRALLIFKKKHIKVILLHCVSLYPVKDKNANLKRMLSLKDKFNVSVGYSDHTLGNDASILATIYGAQVIEKHFTISKNLVGPDHLMSSNPKEFRELIDKINKVKILMGSGEINPKKDEQQIKKKYRRSITSKRFIRKGEAFSRENISLMRPATGLHPKYFKKLIGKKSKKNIKNNKKIIYSDVLGNLN